ncbi:MAG: TIGR04438 family Trp-rich protein, partial [Comamonas sp.]
MYTLILGVILVALKYLEIGPVATWSWWWVLAPFAVTAAWWVWADSTGYT